MNEYDEVMLGMMESDAVKAGLRLATTLQPAIAPLSAIVLALTKCVATRYRNVPIQEFFLGLDFTSRLTGARLAPGSYIAVQIPESSRRIWNWDDWVYHHESGQVTSKSDDNMLIPYNYIIIGVARSEG